MNKETALHQVFQKYQFYISPEHPCGYHEGNVARTLFVDPSASVSMQDYGVLLKLAFVAVAKTFTALPARLVSNVFLYASRLIALNLDVINDEHGKRTRRYPSQY